MANSSCRKMYCCEGEYYFNLILYVHLVFPWSNVQMKTNSHWSHDRLLSEKGHKAISQICSDRNIHRMIFNFSDTFLWMIKSVLNYAIFFTISIFQI